MHPNRLYTYRCNLCGKEFTYDQPAEPMCTGPSENSSDHPPEVMWRVLVKDRNKTKEVGPEEAMKRAEGTLLTPEALVLLKAKVDGRLWTPKDKINPWTGEEMDDRIPE
jgi:hypothetical protein